MHQLTSSRHSINRRQFIQRTGLALGSLGLPLLIEACTPAPAATPPAAGGGATGGAAAPQAAGGSLVPSYVPFPNKPQPDIPSKGDPYEDGYFNYPKNPSRAFPGDPPGTGSTVTAMTIGLFPPPSPYDSNPAWQEINRQLNSDFKMNIVAVGDYITKLATVMAGADLPDLLFMYYNGQTAITAVAGVPQFLEAQAADLTPYLAGDAIKDYPALAAIPSRCWTNSGSVYNGHVWMVPKPLYSEGFVFLKNATQWNQDIGQDVAPKNADDFKRIMQALTKPQENRWAMATQAAASPSDAFDVVWFSEFFGAPNQWRLDSSGKLTKNFETPEFRETVDYVKGLYDAGVFHPNSLQYTNPGNARTDFAAGKWTIWIDGFSTAWSDPWRRALQSSNPFDVLMIPMFPAHDGGKPVHFLNAAHLGATVIKKSSSPDRVKELLRILNWLAAPFGSQEDLLLSYGVAGADYNLDDKGNPVLTDRGNPDANYLPFKYIAQRPPVLYLPDIPKFTQVLADAENQLLPIGISDPTVGYVSPTAVRQNFVLNQTMMDGLRDVIVGRRPFSDFDQLLSDWRTSGGDQIRKELQDAIAQSH